MHNVQSLWSLIFVNQNGFQKCIISDRGLLLLPKIVLPRVHILLFPMRCHINRLHQHQNTFRHHAHFVYEWKWRGSPAELKNLWAWIVLLRRVIIPEKHALAQREVKLPWRWDLRIGYISWNINSNNSRTSFFLWTNTEEVQKTG